MSEPLPLPIVLPPLTVAAPGQHFAPTGLKLQQLGLASWNLDRVNQRVNSGLWSSLPDSQRSNQVAIACTHAANGKLSASQCEAQCLHAALTGVTLVGLQALPLDQQYTFGSMDSAGTGRGVTIYALDSGVRIAHEEFKDWADRTPRVSYGCREWLPLHIRCQHPLLCAQGYHHRHGQMQPTVLFMDCS